jgi:hypothetical protein
MFKANKLSSLVLALVLVLSVVIGVIGCAGGESTSTPSGGEKTAPTSGTGSVAPKGGATFTGTIQITGKASSGTIQFSISGDGASITSVTITLNNLKTDGFSAGSMTQEASGPFTITKGNFTASPSSIGQLEGRFTSSTKASGTIDITLEIPFAGTAELGEWPWSAEAD